jgi:hypothetical protein
MRTHSFRKLLGHRNSQITQKPLTDDTYCSVIPFLVATSPLVFHSFPARTFPLIRSIILPRQLFLSSFSFTSPLNVSTSLLVSMKGPIAVVVSRTVCTMRSPLAKWYSVPVFFLWMMRFLWNLEVGFDWCVGDGAILWGLRGMVRT